MKRRVQAILLCSTQANANTVRDNLIAWLATHPRWGTEASDPVTIQPDTGGWAVSFDCPFNSAQDGTDFMALVQSRWTTGTISTRILSGSRVSIHDCRHDEGVGACVISATAVK